GQGVETATKAIAEANYQPGKIEEVQSQELVQLGDEVDYDYIIIGSGGAAFSSAIEAVKYGAKVAIIERDTVGGTCVNIGCVPSKTLLRSGEINHLAKNNPFMTIIFIISIIALLFTLILTKSHKKLELSHEYSP